MLRMGVFGGNYFKGALPHHFEGLSQEVRGLAQTNRCVFQKQANLYQVKAGETFEQWTKNGWIFPEDPLGWFHWYCRWSNGRDHERDAHQIKRWINYRKRWGRYARTQALTRGDASAVVKQGLIQWAIEPLKIIHEGTL